MTTSNITGMVGPAHRARGRERAPDSRTFSPLSLALLAAFGTWGTSARAADECGVAAGAPPTVTCNDVSQNPYVGGISYSTPSGLTLSTETGLVVNRTPGSGNLGIHVSGSGALPLVVNIGAGTSVSVSGDRSHGVSAYSSADSNIEISSGGTITSQNPGASFDPTTGLFGWAQTAASAAMIDITQLDAGQIQMAGDSTIGIYALSNSLGAVNLHNAGRITILGHYAYGVNGYIQNAASNASVSLSLGENGLIDITGDETAGLYALTNGLGATHVRAEGTIRMTGALTDGVLSVADNASNAALVSADVMDTASIVTNGAGGVGARLFHNGVGATALLNRGAVETNGASSAGLSTTSNGASNTALHTQEMSGNGRVRTSGDNSPGMAVRMNGGAEARVKLQDAARVDTSGSQSHGVQVLATAVGGRGHVALGAGASITTTGGQAFGVRVASNGWAAADLHGQVNASGEHGAGVSLVSVSSSATLDVAAGAQISGGWQATSAGVGAATGRPSAGVVLSGAPSVLNNQGVIGAGSDRALLDDSRYTVPSGNMAITNSGRMTGFVELAAGGSNSFNNATAGTVELRHFADINGDGVRDTKRVSVSDFGDGATSSFSNAGALRLGATAGAATVDATGHYLPTTGATRRALDAAFYNLSREGVVQAQLTNLGEFRHNGTLDMRGPATGNTLVITSNAAAGGAPGSGTFVADGGDLFVNAVLNDGTQSRADMLIVDRTRLGTAATRIHVGADATSLGAVTPGNGIQLVEVRDASGSADGVFELGNRVSAGAYDYLLFHHGTGADAADGNWYLRNTLAGAPGGTPLPNYRPETALYTAMPALTSRLGLAMLGNYHDRLGGDRMFKAEHNNGDSPTPAWGRLFGSVGDTGHKNGSASDLTARFLKDGPRYRFSQWGLQLGVDLDRELLEDDGFDTRGVYLGLGAIDAKVDAAVGGGAGNTRIDSYSLGGYWTRKGHEGNYLDAVVQASYVKGRANAIAGDGVRTRGWDYAASIEGGKPLKLDEHWCLEPQAQLIYQRVALGRARDPVSQLDFGRADAWLGRLGARLARHATASDGMPRLTWARLNLWHNFGARARTTFTDSNGLNPVVLRTALGRTWGQLQLGYSGQTSETASAFVSIDYSIALDGSDGRAWGARVGWKKVW